MQNTDFFDITIFFLWLCCLFTELVASRSCGGDFQLIVHILKLRDSIRDVTDETFFIYGVDRPAQGDMAIYGDDFYVLGIHRESLITIDFLANLRRGINIGLALSLAEWRQGAAITISHIAGGIIRLCSRVGAEIRFHFVGVINVAGITGLVEVGPFVGLEMR